MSVKTKLLWVGLSVLLLSACAGQDTKVDAEQPESAKTAAATSLNTINGVAFDQPDSPDSVRTIYFEYDSSDVRAEYLPVIAAHGKLLAANGSRKVELQGHGDERGSREYNIALGERRALSVRRILLGHGVSGSQITTISYGEEKPAVIGHDESAWSKNRRVEIRYP